MKSVVKCLAVVAVVFALAGYVVAQGQPQGQAPTERTFQGTLVSVNADSHMLIAKDADNKETRFMWADDTQVIGPEKTIQGLAGKTGAKLTINYKVERGQNQATRIEVSSD